MNKTEVPKNPKLPLVKSSRGAFERRYQELFLREPEKGLSDEKLMNAVNNYEQKANPNSESGKEQKTVQKETGNVKNDIDAGTGKNGDDPVTVLSLNRDSYKNLTGKDAEESWTNEEVVKAMESFNYVSLSERYEKLTGVKPLIGWTPEDVADEIQRLEYRASASKTYFDLFGKQPIDSMTNEQILNAVQVKNAEIEEASKAKPAAKAPEQGELKAGQVLATHKVTGETQVFNVHTLKYLPEWEETPVKPKELLK